MGGEAPPPRLGAASGLAAGTARRGPHPPPARAAVSLCPRGRGPAAPERKEGALALRLHEISDHGATARPLRGLLRRPPQTRSQFPSPLFQVAVKIEWAVHAVSSSF